MFPYKTSIKHNQGVDKSWQNQFEQLMSRFTFYLTLPQQHHFRNLVTTMVLWVGSHTIQQLSQVQKHLWERDQSNINRFINRAPWKVQWLNRVRWQWVCEQITAVLPTSARSLTKAPVTGYLVIDDTMVEKTGKKMAGLAWHYSHTEGRTIWGHCYVTALYVIAGFAYPVQVLLYQSQKTCQEQGIRFKSKIDLAAEIIANFKPVPGTRTVVLFDSWYSSETLIKSALSRGFEVTCALKSNRVIYKRTGCKRTEGISLTNLTTSIVHPVTVNNRTYRVRRLEGYIKGNLKATILTTEAPAQNTKYLAHFNPREGSKPLSSEAILNHYVNRWPIETFHRNAKQLLGFNDYRLRSIKGIKRYLEILLIAYTVVESHRGLLSLENPDQPPPSLGDVCRQGQDSSLVSFIYWLYDKFQQGASAEMVCQRLAG